MSTTQPHRFSPTDFMRARRPELYSDSVGTESLAIDRAQLEFHFHTLTQRKDEIRFEHFCRRLAEKELCPNLLPQTGPTGGGDSKADAETYPVADSISERWYEGDPERASQERWAFAFSAKSKWRPKVADDVRKIVEVGRGYSLIYFVSNQAISDRNRSDVEDELRQKYSVDVRILDRSWIVDKVIANKRWDVVYQTLDIVPPRTESKLSLGPLDAERLRDLEELDRLIADQSRYKGSEYQLGEDCLQTALLARGLGRPRVEIDGRFDRAERIARNRGDNRQLFRIIYNRAWTANWWFDDFQELDRLYDAAEPLALNSQWVWDLEKLVNLWQVASTWRQRIPNLERTTTWGVKTTRLREALLRHASDATKPTSALWARTQLLLMDLTNAAKDRNLVSPVLAGIKGLLAEVEGHLDYPVDAVVRIAQELGEALDQDPSYDELIETAIQLQSKRFGNAEEGRMRLERGLQKLKAGKTYDAIDQLARAQGLLAQDEQKDTFLRALVATALAYEAAGLLWAARANLVLAFDRTLYEYVKVGRIAPQSIPLLRKLVWIELQLGRVPCVLMWIEWLALMIRHGLQIESEARQRLGEEYQLIDAVLGILVLRTRSTDWPELQRIAGFLGSLSLVLARGAALFSLGYEDAFRSEYGETETDLDQFFTRWLEQPAATDLPAAAEWHLGEKVSMRTVLMGCEVEVAAENRTTSIVIGEAILAFLEGFLSTAIRLKGHYSARSYLKIELRSSEVAEPPLNHRVIEDECGETSIVVAHTLVPATRLVQDARYHDTLFELLATVTAELHVPFSSASLEGLFAKDRAQDRALLAAQSPVALSNILSEEPRYHIADLIPDSVEENLVPLRAQPWSPNVESPDLQTPSWNFGEGPPPTELFGIDALKHRDLRIFSPINLPLWDKARWRGLGFAVEPGHIPELILLFEDLNAGRKIFRGWRKRIGETDQDEWIGLTLITGIDGDHPAHYRVVISVSEAYIQGAIGPKGQFALVCRMQDMTPQDSVNRDRFLSLFQKAGRYRLAPGLYAPHQTTLPYAGDLFIEKRQLRVVPAWQIGPNDPARAALGGIDNPAIPS